MSTSLLTSITDRAGRDRALTPIDGLVLEREVDPGRFELEDGPFRSWHRTVDAEPLEDGRFSVSERLEFKTAVPIWGPLFAFGIRRSHRGQRLTDRTWWAPPNRWSARSAEVVGTLSVVAILSGYLGTLITQTMAFAADEFGAGDNTSLQGDVLSVTRLGALISLVVSVLGDRWGRRPLIVGAGVASCLATIAGAFAPSLWGLGATQVVARGFATAMIVLFGIHVAEEVPAGSRAYSVSALALAAGLGAGVAVWLLPVADFGLSAWRLLYLVPVLGLPAMVWVAKRLPESARFEVRSGRADSHPRVRVGLRRFLLLGSTAFLMSLMLTPASQLQNQYLKEDLGWTAALITVFSLVTNTPRSLGVIVGGRLADTVGRRIVGSVALVGAIVSVIGTYSSSGWAIWAWALVGVIGAALVPVLGVYGPELFPTEGRGTAGGGISIAGVSGSVTGLVVGGRLADAIGFGSAFTLLAIGPLIVLVLLVTVYPETAGIELEDLNPEDKSE